MSTIDHALTEMCVKYKGIDINGWDATPNNNSLSILPSHFSADNMKRPQLQHKTYSIANLIYIMQFFNARLIIKTKFGISTNKIKGSQFGWKYETPI